MKYLYSPTTNSFYPAQLKDEYKRSGQWPENGVEVDEMTFAEFTAPPQPGKVRAPDTDGMPSWVIASPPKQEESVGQAGGEKNHRINLANAYMNGKQWPGKSVLGRLKKEELVQYNLWLDYLDALEAIDTSNAPDIEWPTVPNQ